MWYCALLRMWCSAWSDVTSRVQCLWFWCLGRCEVSRSEGQTPPDPEGWTCSQSPHQPHGPTSWAPAQKESRTVRPISLAFLGVQQTVGCQSTRATPWIARRAGSFQPPHARLHALLNASAASESTTAGGLKAASLRAPTGCSRGFCFLRVAELKMRSLDSAGVLGPRAGMHDVTSVAAERPPVATEEIPAKIDLSRVPAGDSTTIVVFESCSTDS